MQFTHGWRDTKVVSAAVPLGEGYGWNRLDARLMAESGAGALLKVTMDLELSTRDGGTMIPTMAVELTGAPNGHSASTKFFSGTITGKGYRIRDGTAVTPAVLREVLRTADMAAALRTALAALKAREAADPDYALLWRGR